MKRAGAKSARKEPAINYHVSEHLDTIKLDCVFDFIFTKTLDAEIKLDKQSGVS